MATYVQKSPASSGIPLGGIGTGSVEFRSDGRFYEWNIFNNGMWKSVKFSGQSGLKKDDLFFALRIKGGGKEPIVRLLHSYGNDSTGNEYLLSWLRCIPELVYNGEFPIVDMEYRDPQLPVSCCLKALTPFVPSDVKSSGLPGFLLEFRLTNPSKSQTFEISLLTCARNPVGYDLRKKKQTNEHLRSDEMVAVNFGARDIKENHSTNGTITLAALWPNSLSASFPTSWDKKDWYLFWRHFWKSGVLEVGGAPDEDVAGAFLCNRIVLGPGEESKIRLLFTWHFPNHYRSEKEAAGHMYLGWFGDSLDLAEDFVGSSENLIGHMYTNWFQNSFEVANYMRVNMDYLYSRTLLFHDSFYESNFEKWLLDSINSQLTTLVKNSWWARNGQFALWEGTGCYGLQTLDVCYYGSIPVILLFPELEKSALRLSAAFQTEEGRIPHAFLGTFEGVDRYHMIDLMPKFILMAYRDYILTNDEAFLDEMWGKMKKALECCVNLDQDGDSIPDGGLAPRIQTYDTWPLYGASAYVGCLWLASLYAVTHIAQKKGEDEVVAKCSKIAAEASRSIERQLWNGEYYALYSDTKNNRRDDSCMTAQLNGMIYSYFLDSDYILSRGKVHSSLSAIYKYNRKGECGVTNSNIEDGHQESVPWTGMEYAAASMMIWEGMVQQGLQIVKDIYDRYYFPGLLWDQFECGHHYQRAMDVWLILLALQGMRYDATQQKIQFSPKIRPADHKSFFATPGAWGVFSQQATKESERGVIEVRTGSLQIRTFCLSLTRTLESRSAKAQVSISGKRVTDFDLSIDNNVLVIKLKEAICVGEGQKLEVSVY